MPTEILSIDPVAPQADVVARGAEVIRRGGLVAFPTETVYGLGADALSESAVRRIFAAKGRPPNNPLIVHVVDLAAARSLTADWPDAADRLAQAFWPGPLSLVLRKRPIVPDVVTAGGPTVALRMPGHPVARALLAAAGRPVAAPSANPSTRVSAVRGEHVLRSLEGKVDLILDAGPTSGGLESTVVDLSRATPRLLRPGLVERAHLEEVLGRTIETVAGQVDERAAALPSPGLLAKHYAPSVPVVLTDDCGAAHVGRLVDRRRRVGWITCRPRDAEPPPGGVLHAALGDEPTGYARHLYDTLHRFEAAEVEAIVIELPPDAAGWQAIRDRLRRAAAE